MKGISKLLGVILLVMMTSCTKDEFTKTGISNGRFDGNMLEYMRAHSYDWDLTVSMVEHAGLQSIFEGDEKITFLGPTNHSIRRYMLKNGFKQVQDMDAEFCRTTLLRHILKGKIMREDFPRGKNIQGKVVGEGGEIYTMMEGNKIWAFTFKEDYNDVAEMGAVIIHVTSIESAWRISVASGDIEPDNGVVHALGYDFTLGEM